MKLIAKNTIYGLKENSQDATNPGDVFECDDATALSLLESNSAEELNEEEGLEELPSGPSAEELATAAKAELLAKIATAATYEEINALVIGDDVDPEILEAAHDRSKQLQSETDEPHH